MNRACRLFMISYAVAMVTIAATQFSRHGGDWLGAWMLFFSPALCYVVLALGFVFLKERENSPGKLWLGFAFAVTFSSIGFSWMEDFQTKTGFFLPLVFRVLLAASCLAIIGILLSRLRSGRSRGSGRARYIVLTLSLMLGAFLVLSSLFFQITEGASGWGMLARQKDWITGYYSVGKGFFGPTISWLQPIFAPVGYVFYVLGLVASLTIMILLMQASFSVKKLASTALFARLAVLINLLSLWVVTDIFWGWHFDLSSIPWAAALATACWLAALIFGAVLLMPVALGHAAPWRLPAFLIFGVPVVAFNLMMLPSYFQKEDVYFPGLGLLILGLQIESWACTDLIIAREKSLAEEPTGMAPLAAG